MRWQFHGKIGTRTVFPLNQVAYNVVVKQWFVGEIQSDLRNLINSADIHASVTHYDQAIINLKNGGSDGDKIIELNKCKDSISSAVIFNANEPSRKPFFSYQIGLKDAELNAVSQILDLAFLHGNTVNFADFSGFSVSESNPHSQQPTENAFASGRHLGFYGRPEINVSANERVLS